MNNHLDSTDQELLAKRILARESLQGPRIGDYILFPTGQLERFSHDCGHGLQTSPGGSFYIFGCGESSFSGGLNPTTPLENLELTSATLMGNFWFFHHGFAGAHRGVDCLVPCRVYKTSAKYEGFLGSDFQSPAISRLQADLARQLGAPEFA